MSITYRHDKKTKIITENYSSSNLYWSIRLWFARKLMGNRSVMGNCDVINTDTIVTKPSLIYGCRFMEKSRKIKNFTGTLGIVLKPLK